jgi:PhzF family phenazine biosynthesis protein
MSGHRFMQVDVFTARALAGNPVAVVLEADDLDDAVMQRLASWTNLSETTFVLRPSARGADYRLRIFTPRSELPFAGHPTIGSAHTVLEAGLVPADATRLVQECGAGLLPLRVERTASGRRLFVRVPEARVRRERVPTPDALARVLGAEPSDDPLAIDVGPVWLVARLADEAAVRALRPDGAGLAQIGDAAGATGVTVFALREGAGPRVVVRSFAPAAGVPEDPVCGSGNASVAAYLVAAGLLARMGDTYVASQGRELGRDGEVHVRVSEEGRAIEIGGQAVTLVDGLLHL